MFLKKLNFFSAGKNLGTSWAYCVPDKPEKLQANLSLKHCHVFSHTAPPICAKNLSNYLSSGKPYLIIYLCLGLTDCSHCFLFIQQPDDLSAKLCVSLCSKFFPNHTFPSRPRHPSLHRGRQPGSSLGLRLPPTAPGQGASVPTGLQVFTGIPRCYGNTNKQTNKQTHKHTTS